MIYWHLPLVDCYLLWQLDSRSLFRSLMSSLKFRVREIASWMWINTNADSHPPECRHSLSPTFARPGVPGWLPQAGITNAQQALKDLKSLLVTTRNTAPRKCMIQNQFVHGECLPITMHNSSNSWTIGASLGTPETTNKCHGMNNRRTHIFV